MAKNETDGLAAEKARADYEKARERAIDSIYKVRAHLTALRQMTDGEMATLNFEPPGLDDVLTTGRRMADLELLLRNLLS